MAGGYVISVPGGLTRMEHILALNERIQALGKNVTIQAFDAVQGLRWNGGRIVMSKVLKDCAERADEHLSDVTVADLPEVVRRVRLLNDHGIAFNLTVNNTLEKLDVEDPEGNYLLEHLQNDVNLVTVSTQALNRHVQTRYPGFKRVASICFTLGSLREYQEACRNFDLVVAMPFIAYRSKILAQLPLEKLSFILNDECALFCRRKEHYARMSHLNLVGNRTREEQIRNVPVKDCLFRNQPGYRQRIPQGCEDATPELKAIGTLARDQSRTSRPWTDLPGGQEYNITRATRKALIEMGINHFKIQGREMSDTNYRRKVEGFLETFVRDEL